MTNENTAEAMERYLCSLKEDYLKDPEKTKAFVLDSLKESGFLDGNGRVKGQIVSWGH